MHKSFIPASAGMRTIAAALLLALAAHTGAAQSKPAEEVYKNIQALKGVPEIGRAHV